MSFAKTVAATLVWPIVGLTGFVYSFGKSIYDMLPSMTMTGGSDTTSTAIIDARSAVQAIKDGRWNDLADSYRSLPAEVKQVVRKAMLDTEVGRNGLAAHTGLASAVLADLDPETLKGFDFDGTFGEAKGEVIALSVLKVAAKSQPQDPLAIDRNFARDPEVFGILSKKITVEQWNDPKTGLGTRVCQQLWQSRGYDEICSLIRAGVDTTVAARSTSAQKGGGVYSGFVQPLQHIVQGSLRDIDTLDKDSGKVTGLAKLQANGAKKIFATLGETATAITVTKWDDVTNSELLSTFKEAPGTIWGFEDIRLPYVQAAHDTDVGAQPLRMMELWEAVEEALQAEQYERLLDDPEKVVDEIVELGLKALNDGLVSTIPSKQKKYTDLKRMSEKAQKEYKENFKRDAKNFLLEMAAQMPKVTFDRPTLDDQNQPTKMTVSELAGIEKTGKFGGGIACKAGLWWAKNDVEGKGKPVYYCLDGVKMAEVTDYKKVKNAAIEAYLTSSKDGPKTKGHDEVITFVELREIIKNWDDLKGIVKFVLKGKVYSQKESEEKVTEWRKALEEANKTAGRAPAPPKADFANELKAIDPGLLDKIPDDKEGDKDARDIVRKTGYLVKVAKRHPQIVLKYIMSKCGVLLKYELISGGLVENAKLLYQMSVSTDVVDSSELTKVAETVLKEAEKSNEKFKGPLVAALVAHPLMKRAGK